MYNVLAYTFYITKYRLLRELFINLNIYLILNMFNTGRIKGIILPYVNTNARSIFVCLTWLIYY